MSVAKMRDAIGRDGYTLGMSRLEERWMGECQPSTLADAVLQHDRVPRDLPHTQCVSELLLAGMLFTQQASVATFK